MSLRDAFFSKYIFGGTLTYHPLETLGVSLRLGYCHQHRVRRGADLHLHGRAARRAPRAAARSDLLNQLDGPAPGQLTLLGGVDVQWAPIYGKLSLLAEKLRPASTCTASRAPPWCSTAGRTDHGLARRAPRG